MSNAEPSYPKFIPLTKEALMYELLYEARQQRLLSNEQLLLFEKVADTLSGLYHYKFRKLTERFTELYSPLCNDTETYEFRNTSQKQLNKNRAELLQLLDHLLQKANYQSIDLQQNETQKISSSHPLASQFPLEEFDVFKLYTREAPPRPSMIASDPLPMDGSQLHSRVCFIAKFKKHPYADFKENPYLYLKLFKNVPQDALGMIVPQNRPKISARKSKVLPLLLLLSIATSIAFYLKKLSSTQSLILLSLWFLLLLVFLYKKGNQKKQHLVSFNRNLYFSSMDNNFGVFYHLVHSAEEEEFKEAILVYFFVLTSSEYFNPKTLNKHIQTWLKNVCRVQIDFDISDGIQKLQEAQLLFHQNGTYLGVIDLNSAYTKLKQDWLHLIQ